MQLMDTCNAASRDWVPPVLEVHLWDYSYCPNKGLEWPAHWPTLGSTDKPYVMMERKSSVAGRAFSAFLPSSERAEVDKMMAHIRSSSRACVLFEGIKYSAIMRVPLPGERHWLGNKCGSAALPETVLPQSPPVLVVHMSNPWAMVLGAEAPPLVVYEDGLCVMAGACKCTQIKFDLKEWVSLLDVLGSLSEAEYSASDCTDQPHYSWTYWSEPGNVSTRKTISVYGDLHRFVQQAGPIPESFLTE
eukprot:TRINITY_DN1181_c0_g1_i1.p1 TRINITY_DN1181_c0_g1~~TRINITY_DN1181_c0_g1_i1.p1  ORF type:complete len:246 (-),score=31.58 TRINITY_DN1181_c0_g1_i1:69-806(-)